MLEFLIRGFLSGDVINSSFMYKCESSGNKVPAIFDIFYLHCAFKITICLYDEDAYISYFCRRHFPVIKHFSYKNEDEKEEPLVADSKHK